VCLTKKEQSIRCRFSPTSAKSLSLIVSRPPSLCAACPGLRAKKPEIRYSAAIGEGESGVPAEWGDEFSFAFFDCEHNPFTRKAFFNEVRRHGSLAQNQLRWLLVPQAEIVPIWSSIRRAWYIYQCRSVDRSDGGGLLIDLVGR
jgi:hypothetical protein